MSNQKFLNKVKEFSEELDHKYDIESFNLKDSYCESLLVTVNIGGSSGGDCWGGHTCDYEVNDDEIVSNLASSLNYILRNHFSDYIMVELDIVIKEHLSNINRYDYIARGSDSSDYYGNYYEKGVYAIPVYPLVKLLLDDEHFQMFKSYLSNQKNKIEKVFVDRKTEKRIGEINQKIASFESDKAKELGNLKDNIKKYESALKSMKEQAQNFATTKTKELNKLKEELKKLEG